MNTIKLTATEDGRIKIRVVNPSERDQSAVVSFDDLQEAIRLTQTGDEAELPLEPDEPGGIPSEGDPAAVPPNEVDDTQDTASDAPGEGDGLSDPATPVEVDLSEPVEGEPVVDQEPSAPAADNVADG